MFDLLKLQLMMFILCSRRTSVSLRSPKRTTSAVLTAVLQKRFSVPGNQHANDMTAIGLCTDFAGKNKYVQNINDESTRHVPLVPGYDL